MNTNNNTLVNRRHAIAAISFGIATVFAALATAQTTPKLATASDLDCDKDGNIYVLGLGKDESVPAIYKYSSQGAYLDKILNGGHIYSLAVDKRDGVVYFAVASALDAATLWKAAPSDKGYKIERVFTSSIRSNNPRIAIGANGDVYFEANGLIEKIQKIDGRHILVTEGATKLLAVDSKGCVMFRVDTKFLKEIWKAVPDDSGLSYSYWKYATVDTCDAIALDTDDNMYIADRSNGTVRKDFRDKGEWFFPGHYGDLHALLIKGDTLYIANGIDGVLKVNVTTGQCFGSQLFPLFKGQRFFTRKSRDGHYYISCNRSLFEYDATGKELGEIWTGNEVTGVAFDKDDNLLFNASSGDKFHGVWRRDSKPEMETEGFGRLEAVATTKKRAFFVCNSRKEIMSSTLNERFDNVTTWASNLEHVEGLATAGNGDLYFVIGNALGRIRAAAVGVERDPVERNFIAGLQRPRAVAVDGNENIYVTNEGAEPRIGRYTAEGKHVSDLISTGSMKKFRDLFADRDGSVIVLQTDGVWKYSNRFAK
ncbi:MAG TPA: hypothetical protein VIS99_15040 [Terrimicrobiaceae bacterium]